MRALIAAGLMAGMAVFGGAGVAQAQPVGSDGDCPVTQLCGAVSREYAGDQDGARYAETLSGLGMPGVTAEKAAKLARIICQKRAGGLSSDYMITHLQADTGASSVLAVNAVAMAEYHFCPSYWDLG